jgi:organic hydroperoxide reductase OsmC/OhrA
MVRATEWPGTVESYSATIRWTGNLGDGTREYGGYSRDHLLEIRSKPPVLLTSGLSPRSDPHRQNPEELLVGALASCHLLWYLHLCSENGVVVSEYSDTAEGRLELDPDRGGRFVDATLHPHVRILEGELEVARRLHEEAHRRCFIANSVSFPVKVEPVVERGTSATRDA